MLVGLPLCGLVACSSEKDTMHHEMAMEPAISVADQPVAGDSVTIASATVPEGGFVVIHEVIDGKPQAPQSIGHTPIKAGTTSDVVVKLDKDVPPGSTLIAMLHNDTGTIGVYEFGPGSTDQDKPTTVDGKPVVKPFKVK